MKEILLTRERERSKMNFKLEEKNQYKILTLLQTSHDFLKLK